MAPNPEQINYPHAQAGEGPADHTSRYFVAPASEAFGGSVTVGVLAEGIDGSPKSREASRIASVTIEQYFISHPVSEIVLAIAEAITAAHSAIVQWQNHDPTLARMGTSIAVAVLAADRLFVGNVGNSTVYIVREDIIRKIAPERTWLSQAKDSWQVSAGEMPEHLETVLKSYLGMPGRLVPEIRPVEFLWPGNTVLLCTSRLAHALEEDAIKNVIISSPYQKAASQLVEMARERGEQSNLVALVITTPRPGVTVPDIPKPRQGVSRSVVALVLGNLLLFCAVAFVLFRGAPFNTLLAPAPTIEIAKPVFVATPIFVATPVIEATPTEDPGDPFAFPPGVAVAPALAPSVTPVPTFTPIALAANWTAPSSLVPQVPSNGFLFGGPDASVILAWDSAGDLPEDVFYVVTIRKLVNNTLVGESKNWTKSNRIRLDASFYTADAGGPHRIGMGAPLLADPIAKFEWFVTLYRLTSIQPDGTLTGVPISQPSATRTFLWGPAPQLAPTRVYGSETLENDPFFAADASRHASANMTMLPISAGMGLVTLGMSLYAAWPKLRKKLGRGSRARH
jgi:PPM family protein phosphatase